MSKKTKYYTAGALALFTAYIAAGAFVGMIVVGALGHLFNAERLFWSYTTSVMIMLVMVMLQSVIAVNKNKN